MEAETPKADPPKRKGRWLPLPPDGLLLSLLVVEVFIVSCSWFRWFGFHEDRVWTAWFALAGVAVAAVISLIRTLVRGRRWYQFSLRSLLVFTLICAIASAWVAHRMERKRDEQEAVDAIVKKGALVSYDYQIQQFSGFNANAQPPGPEWMRRLVGKNFFGVVERVEFLCGTGRPIVTDADLVHLRALPKLKTLVLRAPGISDAGLANLEELTGLRGLDLSGTSITDAGLVHIKGLTSLTWLDIRSTKVTDAGRAELQEALPGCLLQR